MNTRLVLDFKKIRGSEEPLPAIGVADFIPLKKDKQDLRSNVKGMVLELNKPETLEQGLVLPGGPGIFYVRLPTGEMLAERIDIKTSRGADTGMLVLEVIGAVEPTNVMMDSVSAYAAPRRRFTANNPRATSSDISSDRSRWSTIEVPRIDGPSKRMRPKLSSFLEPFASQVVSERQGNRGIAKIQSSAGTFSPLPSRLSKHPPFNNSLVGQVQAVKPVKLRGRPDELYAKWKKPLSAGRTMSRDEGQQERHFALSFEATEQLKPLQVACIPGRWRTRSDVSGQVTMKYVSDRLVNGQKEQRVVVSVEDPMFEALLQFMQTGDLASSLLLVQAEHALYEKVRNPYAAAAGGYVLTHTGYHGWNKDWGRWLYNLATSFPALPDGHILLANLILQGPELIKEKIPGYSANISWEIALSSVLEAVRRGPPMYRFGLRMLSSCIAILNHLVRDDDTNRDALEAAASYVWNLSVRVDRHQPFCVFDLDRTRHD